MKTVLQINLVILVLLAISSGVTKIMLMPQEVQFFGSVGFSNLMLIIFGVSQVVGGLMLVLSKTRLIGAIIIVITFIISAVVLFMSENIVVAIITCFTLFMLSLVIKQNLNSPKK
ncbi:MAG: DoxX family protein [Kangiellaceae bacterium]|nr:DoxX family protein [Kangiellaceae bacterium]